MYKTDYANNKLILLGLAILSALTTPVYAQEEPVQTRNVVVTATRTEQEVKETPAAVEVITQEQLQAKGATSLRQALEASTNLSFDVDGMMGAQVSIRGSNPSHVLILVDGKRISGETSLSRTNTFEIDRIKMENVERVEIVRGPASALYGSDALGGMINIITKKPDKPQWQLHVETHKADAFDDGRDWSIRYDAGQQGRFGWTLSAGEYREDPYTKPNGDTVNYYGKRRPINFQGVWQAGDHEKITFGYDYLDEDTERLVGTTWYINDNVRTDYNLGYEVKNGGKDYQLRVYKSIYDKNYESRNKNTKALTSFDVIKREVTTWEGRASQAWKGNHLLTYGGEYREEFVRGTRLDSGVNNFTLEREGKAASGSEASLDYYAGYVQDEWAVNERLLLISALRFDGSDKFESAWSPKVGATYKLQPNSRLKANFGYGFKTPTTTELYHNFLMGRAYYFEGNPDLQPEKSRSFEFGWEGEKGPHSGKITYFHNDIKDLIESYNTGGVYNGTIPVRSYSNVGKATIQGIETEYGNKLSDKLTMQLNYTYLDAVNKSDGTRLKRRARHQIGTSLNYADKARGITGSLWGTWKANFSDDYQEPAKQKTYGIWNVLVNKELDDTTTMYIGVDNIFNHKDDELWINGTIYRTGLKMKF